MRDSTLIRNHLAALNVTRHSPHQVTSQRAEFVYFWIKIPRGVEGREGRKEELTQSGNKTITRGVISWSKKEIFRFFGVIFL